MLSVKLIAGFVNKVLLPTFDQPVPIPAFHIDLWNRCTSNSRFVALACPRGFAKSTAITLSLTLANLLFREKRYVIVVSDTEEQAVEFLSAMKTQIKENQELKNRFPILQFTKDGSTDFIVEMVDGHKFRVLAKGAGQKVRGRLWNNTRPDLIVIDDLENDEMVESLERRNKLYSWLLRAVIPALSKNGNLIIIGTILHLDSVLMRCINSNSFNSVIYKAHKSFDDFSELLWPEFWPEERLKEMRQQYLDSNAPEGYSQEYLNNPTDLFDSFFRNVDFIPMDDKDLSSRKTYYIGVDFAISDADKADYTAMVVGGIDENGILHIVESRRGRWDSFEIVSNIFELQELYKPELFIFERGAIEKAIGPYLEKEEEEKGVYIPKTSKTPYKDKRSRARPLQGRMRAGKVRFNTQAGWYPQYLDELISFPRGIKKDQVDATAWIGLALAETHSADTEKDIDEEEYKKLLRSVNMFQGRSQYTGY